MCCVVRGECQKCVVVSGLVGGEGTRVYRQCMVLCIGYCWRSCCFYDKNNANVQSLHLIEAASAQLLYVCVML